MMKKNRTKIIAGIIIVISPIVAFFANSEVPQNQSFDGVMLEETVKEPESITEKIEEPSKETPALEQKEQEKPKKTEETAKQKETEPVVEKTAEIEPVIEEVSEPELEKKDELTCTMSVRCDTILENVLSLKEEKRELLPENGVIYPEQTVTFSEGESVFDLLVREMKKNNIHLEFVKTPGYNSAYIEGIGNFYEFDCGEMSGWMCKVNGRFLKTGPSQYMLKDKDKVEWVYTCDLGKDVGEQYAKQ